MSSASTSSNSNVNPELSLDHSRAAAPWFGHQRPFRRQMAEQNRQRGRRRLHGLVLPRCARSCSRIHAPCAGEHPLGEAILHLDHRRRFPRRFRSPDRPPHGGHASRRHRSWLAHPHLLHRLHGPRGRLLPLLLLPEPLHVLHAHPRPRLQLRPPLRRLGRRGPLELPAHRLLFPAQIRPGRRQETLHPQSHRPFPFHPRPVPPLHTLRHSPFFSPLPP